MKFRKRLAAVAAALLMSFTPFVSGAADIKAEAASFQYTTAESSLQQFVPRKAQSRTDTRILEKMTTETIVEYTSPSSAMNSSRELRTVVYGFDTRRSVGMTYLGDIVQTEAEYGVTVYKRSSVSMTRLYIKAYNYTDREISVKSSYLTSLDKNNSYRKKVNVKFETRKLETEDLQPGLYRFEVTFSDKKTVYIYFYVNGTSSAPCIAENVTSDMLRSYIYRRKVLTKALSRARTTAENTLSLDLMYYPNYAFDSDYRCDTQRWVKLSGQLVDKSWSDEHKVYVIFDWVINNIAYDTYIADNSDYSRATTYGDWSGRYSVWETRAGICHDYANILTIMLRAQGIPATTIGSEKLFHVWNVVYINNRWVELDGAACNRYEVLTRDTSDRVESRLESDGSCYMYECAFNILPHYSSTPSDLVINDSLMYDVYYIC